MNYSNPLDHHTKLVFDTVPSMRWDGKTSIEEWRSKSRDQLRELLGMNAFQPCEPIFSVLAEDEIEGYRHIHFTLQTEAEYFTHCHLLLPQKTQEKFPLCVCLPGHHGKNSFMMLGEAYCGEEIKGDRDIAMQAVREGFAALVVELRGFGLCGGTEKGTSCSRASVTALLLGRTLIGERVWDVMRALDFAERQFEDVITFDGSLMVGHSAGGTVTYYTACLDDRISGFMPSCGVCEYRDHLTYVHNCACNYVPNLVKYFEMSDLALLIAPKKMTVICGENDIYYPFEKSLETFYSIQRMYEVVGAKDSCQLVIGHDGHRFYADEGWKTMKTLLGRV